MVADWTVLEDSWCRQLVASQQDVARRRAAGPHQSHEDMPWAVDFNRVPSLARNVWDQGLRGSKVFGSTPTFFAFAIDIPSLELRMHDNVPWTLWHYMICICTSCMSRCDKVFFQSVSPSQLWSDDHCRAYQRVPCSSSIGFACWWEHRATSSRKSLKKPRYTKHAKRVHNLNHQFKDLRYEQRQPGLPSIQIVGAVVAMTCPVARWPTLCCGT